MTQIIAGIYEIERQIGAGGGGIVYLGRHLRLDKQIVLKADKRTLSASPEALRREVKMLKDLSHTYIPQVYDFVQQDGVAYTVMDFIQGESLDKLLARGERPSQPQVIEWACQLLEALVYLHSRPPHGILHGDIKPANIMVRPDGTICLIDFNIALALGEDGAVKVGRSRGYASPEHYGIEYSNLRPDPYGKTLGMDETEAMEPGVMEPGDDTELMAPPNPEDDTELMTVHDFASRQGVGRSGNAISPGSFSSRQSVMLDVRSDIYSLGATLYHLISGNRPVPEAIDVEPLGSDACSPAVAAIIRKAMSPRQEMRYQSAEEMLTAFRLLHKRDRRTIRHKRRVRTTAALLTLLFLAGGASAFTGLKQMEKRQTALTLAEYSADKLAQGDVEGAIRQALQAMPEESGIFGIPVTAQAQKALTDALGVYDVFDGFKDLPVTELPSAPFQVTASPDGTRFAAVYSGEAAVFDMESGRQEMALPIQDSALADFIFVDDERAVYAGEQGVTALNLETGTPIWNGEKAVTLAVSGDGKTVAAADRSEDRAVIYRMDDGEKLMECSFDGRHLPAAFNDIFANPANSIFELNQDGSLLAVSFDNGDLWIFDLNNPENDMILYEESDFIRFAGGFSGKYFAYTADKNGQALFGLIDTEQAVYTGGFESKENFGLIADERGIYLSSESLLVRFDPDTLEEMELAYTEDAQITGFSVGNGYVLTATDDQKISFFDEGASLMSAEQCQEISDFVCISGEYAVFGNRSQPTLRRMKLESHADAQMLSYDARYPHDEARFSKDGETAMLFSFEDFRIYNKEGTLVNQVELPDSETIYDQQFYKDQDASGKARSGAGDLSDGESGEPKSSEAGGQAGGISDHTSAEIDGSWLEVIWYDGTRRCYSAADGSLLSEEKGAPPEKDLYEEFYTRKYRIASGLHDAPEVYDLETGRKVADLEKDSYLTYVTEVGDWIITEYISAAGERYGLLLNDSLETLAVLPGLCDVQDGMAVFDDYAGNLRQCRLYSLQELRDLGETYLKENGEKGAVMK